MDVMQVQGSGGYVEYDGVRVEIVRDGIWNTLTGMKGTRSLQLREISGIRFRRAKRGHGPGFIQFLRVDDPIGEAQKKLLGVYGRKDDIASAQLDDYAMMFDFRQHASFVELKEAIERDLGQDPSPIEEPTVAIKAEIWRPGEDAPTDFADLVDDDPDTAPIPEVTRPARSLRPQRSTRPMQPGPKSTWRVPVQEPVIAEPVPPVAAPEVAATQPVQGSDHVINAITKLAELRDLGIISEAEFSAKKAELLARL